MVNKPRISKSKELDSACLASAPDLELRLLGLGCRV